MKSSLRFGLCCLFHSQPIKFRVTTAAALRRLSGGEAKEKLSRLCRTNAEALDRAVDYCKAHGIGAFRVNSRILPMKSHPDLGYEMGDLPGGSEIVAGFRKVGEKAASADIRLSFHPDQFIVLNSPRPEVVEASIRELEYQAEAADWLGADGINLHAGGVYGDKSSALGRLERTFNRLPDSIRSRLTLENDDRGYTPSDLLPLCRQSGIPLVYDVHHHRCLPDGLSVERATAGTLATWDREPVFHISSPRKGWNGPNPRLHHDFIDPADFPEEWLGLAATVEVEAKAKELAVARLMEDLAAVGA